jgi:hypothetical protein
MDETSACAIARPILEEDLPDELHSVGLLSFRPRRWWKDIIVDRAW